MESIKAPQGAKRLLTYFINLLLFIVYFYALSFILGFTGGIVAELMGNDASELSDKIIGVLTLAALAINIVLAFVLRRKIYFHIINHETAEPVVPTVPTEQ